MIFSKPPNILLPNLVLWCLTVSWSACKKIGLLFQGQGHSKGSYDQNMTVSFISAELLTLLLPNLVWWYIIISQNFLWRNGIVVFKVKVTAKFQNDYESLSGWYLLNQWTFTTKLGLVMHHYGPDCLPIRLVFCLQGQGHSEGACNQNMPL